MFMNLLTFICFCMSAMAWLMVGGLIAFALLQIYRKTLSYETFADIATVVRTEFEDSVMFEPEYFVHVSYKGKEYTIEDEALYRKANVGEDILVRVHEGYNRDRKVRAVYLTKHLM